MTGALTNESLFKRLHFSFSENASYLRPLSLSSRVLYAVSHSLPFSSDGYATRTHGVASALVHAGISVTVASRPGVPWNQTGFQSQGFSSSHLIDGVRYVHARYPSETECTLVDYLTSCIDIHLEWIRVFKPSVVIAASNWRNALPAAIAARESGLPFFYEVRGFWEISRASKDLSWADSDAFRFEVQNETLIAQHADEVFTINRLMRDELERRGVTKSSIHLIPNSFDFPSIQESDYLALKRQLDIKAKYVIGYVGSFSEFEGLHLLIEAAARLRGEGVDVAVLLVGSGKSMGLTGAPEFDS